MAAMTVVRCEQIRKSFGDVKAVDGFDLELVPGRMTALLGPSGCGKTTALRIIAGFERPDSGSVRIDGEVVAGDGNFVPPEKRGVGVVFQDYALFPHLTVAGNIGYALGRRPEPARVSAALSRVGLSGLAERYPHELSGGEQQRVALARVLIAEPRIVLLDEPFSNLDAALRVQMRREVRELLADVGVTSVLVTHDQEEALAMADRVAVMNRGRVEQSGDPRSVYMRPAGCWVARFLGEVNSIRGQVRSGVCECEFGRVPTPTAPDGPVVLMVRPEALSLSPDGTGTRVSVISSEFFGPTEVVTVVTGAGTVLRVRQVGFGGFPSEGDASVVLSGPVSAITPGVGPLPVATARTS
jgi:iron(III) transport system ATP-binding protein